MDYQNAPADGTGDAHVATSASAGHCYYRPPAKYSLQTSQGQLRDRPWALTQTLIQLWKWVVWVWLPEAWTHIMYLWEQKLRPPPGSMSTLELAAMVARGVAAAATQILDRYARPPNEAERPPVDQVADAALQEHLQRCLKGSPWTTPSTQPTLWKGFGLRPARA